MWDHTQMILTYRQIQGTAATIGGRVEGATLNPKP